MTGLCRGCGKATSVVQVRVGENVFVTMTACGCQPERSIQIAGLAAVSWIPGRRPIDKEAPGTSMKPECWPAEWGILE